MGIRFVTNTTKESLSSLHSRLQRLGFDIQRDEIFSSLTAARNAVVEGGLRPLLLLQEDAKRDFEGNYLQRRQFTCMQTQVYGSL